MTCESCGVDVQIGAWPWCPHDLGSATVVADDVPGGFVAVNGFAEPTRFDSRSAHRHALAANGYEICAKHAGPDDKICSRFDTVDLDGAKRFLESQARVRVPVAKTTDRWPRADVPITVTLAGPIRQKDLP